LTNLKLDYYDNLKPNEPFEFCSNIKSLSVTFSKVRELNSIKTQWIQLKNGHNDETILCKFSNLTDLHIESCDYGYNCIINGLKKLDCLTSINVDRRIYIDYNRSTLTNLTRLYNIYSDVGFSSQQKTSILDNLSWILSEYEYRGVMGD
jgi:hypothetical protein